MHEQLQAIITVLSLITRFMGLIVLSMGIQFALTGYRAFMK